MSYPHPQLPPGGGRRRRWLLPLILVLLVTVPLAEVWLLLQVGNWIGLLPTVGLLVVITFFGTWLSRRQGGRAWKSLNDAVDTGRMPSGELADTALILIGAVLLVFPGFFTDIIALVFLLPFTRPLAKKLFGWMISRQAQKYADGGILPPTGAVGYPRSPGESTGPSQPGQAQSGQDDVIEGEVVESPDDRV